MAYWLWFKILSQAHSVENLQYRGYYISSHRKCVRRWLGYLRFRGPFCMHNARAECTAIITAGLRWQVKSVCWPIVQIWQSEGTEMRGNEVSVLRQQAGAYIRRGASPIFDMSCSAPNADRINVPILSLKFVSERERGEESRKRPKILSLACYAIVPP